MKKIISLVFVLMLCCTVNCFAENTVWESNKITVYTVGYDEMCEILENPSMELLEKIDKENIKYISITDNWREPIKLEQFRKGEYIISEGESGVRVFGSFQPVYTSFIDFVGNKNNVLGAFLEENGVIAEVNKAVVLDIQEVSSIVIWVQVNNENYFITVDEMWEDLYADDEENVFRFYTFSDYKEKHGEKEARLIVNGKDITDGNYVKIYQYNAYMPLRAIMEEIGLTVDWNSEKETVILYDKDNTYAFNPKYPYCFYRNVDSSLENVNFDIESKEDLMSDDGETFAYGIHYIYEDDNKKVYTFTLGGGYSMYANVVDGRTIVNDFLVHFLFTEIDASLNIDYDTNTIEINAL